MVEIITPTTITGDCRVTQPTIMFEFRSTSKSVSMFILFNLDILIIIQRDLITIFFIDDGSV